MAELAELAAACAATLAQGGQVIFFGNGGSAAQAEHLAAELVGRYAQPGRRALAARALSGSGALLTALGNDYGFQAVFARQVEGMARRGDVLIGLSTSGRSPNVRKALEVGRRMGCVTSLWTGDHEMSGETPPVEHLIRVSSRETPMIQEMHLVLGHLLCQSIEEDSPWGEGVAVVP
ncbi:MAG: SIS domain-containing protein [Acidobacteriota bacterium]